MTAETAARRESPAVRREGLRGHVTLPDDDMIPICRLHPTMIERQNNRRVVAAYPGDSS